MFLKVGPAPSWLIIGIFLPACSSAGSIICAKTSAIGVMKLTLGSRVTAVCACGNSFETRSTSSSIHVEVCAQCHPYFTGKQRLVDTAGRVDRFRRKYQSEPAAAAPKA